jgi:hypothetical protein
MWGSTPHPLFIFRSLMNDKMIYTTAGFALSFVNILLIETRFTIVGMFFGFVACGFFIKAIRTKP